MIKQQHKKTRYKVIPFAQSQRPRIGVYRFFALFSLPFFLLLLGSWVLLGTGISHMTTSVGLVSSKYLPGNIESQNFYNNIGQLYDYFTQLHRSSNMTACRNSYLDAKSLLEDTAFKQDQQFQPQFQAMQITLGKLWQERLKNYNYVQQLNGLEKTITTTLFTISAITGRSFPIFFNGDKSIKLSREEIAKQQKIHQTLVQQMAAPLELCTSSRNNPDLANPCRIFATNYEKIQQVWKKRAASCGEMLQLWNILEENLDIISEGISNTNIAKIHSTMLTIDKEMQTMKVVLAIAFVAVLLCCVLGFAFFIRCIVKPIAQASAQLDQLRRDGSCTTLPPSRISEINNLVGMVPLLAHTFNELHIRSQRLEEENTQLETMSLMDKLTALPNRRCLDNALESYPPDAPLALFLIDIDHFKLYNDSLGHQKGDTALQEVARISADIIKPYGCLYRYGGEEFCAIIPGSDKERARAVAEATCAAVRSAGLPHPTSQIVTISIGVAWRSGKEHTSPADLLKFADHALYDSKRAGRNQVTFYISKEAVEPHPQTYNAAC